MGYLKAVKPSWWKRLKNKNWSSVLSKLPIGVSLLLIITWALILIISGLGGYFTAGVMVLVILLLTTAIACKNAPIGGCIFVLLGSGYLIFSMGQLMSMMYVLAVAPLFLVGTLFILGYLYQSQKEQEGGVDDF
jgi:hypothetical protein